MAALQSARGPIALPFYGGGQTRPSAGAGLSVRLSPSAREGLLADKPAFWSAFRWHRCLIPTNGFYEWAGTGENYKQPYYIRMQDSRPFALAGLWERWQDGEGEPVETCAILTADANEVVRPIHDRMPVILAPGEYAGWLIHRRRHRSFTRCYAPTPVRR